MSERPVAPQRQQESEAKKKKVQADTSLAGVFKNVFMYVKCASITIKLSCTTVATGSHPDSRSHFFMETNVKRSV